jgi:hypothetical protein
MTSATLVCGMNASSEFKDSIMKVVAPVQRRWDHTCDGRQKRRSVITDETLIGSQESTGCRPTSR